MHEPAEISRVREIARAHGTVDAEDVIVLLEYYDNAKARLRLARGALLDDGYFTPDQVDDEIAPRIHERLAAARQEIDGLIELLHSDGEPDEPDEVTTGLVPDPDCVPCDQPDGRLGRLQFALAAHAAMEKDRDEYAEANEQLRATHSAALAAHEAALARVTTERDEARAQRDQLREHILDIDAHATPYGDIPDDPGYVGNYLLTAGALHRALGKIGHTAPSCPAEAQRAAALALHPNDGHGWCAGCITGEDYAGELVYGQEWPCENARALGITETPDA